MKWLKMQLNNSSCTDYREVRGAEKLLYIDSGPCLSRYTTLFLDFLNDFKSDVQDMEFFYRFTAVSLLLMSQGII